ncbi:DUF4292 domain-containing protein [Solitalea koreensis]|uniref:DUF4292 domain-containing protein n=1 Tax=Solitalea koreensis TaxID=543615 RepID=A0A521CRM7_9SPHI|nr:DUF4292 domain-containing protein [Solitalea koreensis]SMO62035.1 protein of unknown function [Solitalea koreensis]
MIRHYTIKPLILLSLSISLFACKAKKGIVENKPINKKELSEVEKAKVLFNSKSDNAELAYEYFTARGKVGLVVDGKTTNASLNLRMKKDKVIWASIGLIGIEGARALITPDSVRIIIRFGNNSYFNKSFDYIRQITNKNIDFKTLQAILVGNKLYNFTDSADQFKIQDLLYVITGVKDSLQYVFNYNNYYKTESFNVTNTAVGQNLDIHYGGFSTFADKLVPQEVNAAATSAGKQIGLEIRYNKIGINEPVDFPFSVPKRLNKN